MKKAAQWGRAVIEHAKGSEAMIGVTTMSSTGERAWEGRGAREANS